MAQSMATSSYELHAASLHHEQLINIIAKSVCEPMCIRIEINHIY